MGLLVGLLCGIGLLLVLTAVTDPHPWRPTSSVGWRALGWGALGASGLGTAAWVVTAIPVLGLLGAFLGGCLPMVLARRQRLAAQRARAAAWPELIDDLISAVRAGQSLPEALADNAHTGPPPLRAGLAVFATAWRRGFTATEALRAMKPAFADPIADRVVISLILAQQSGGAEVGRVLATLSDFVRSDLRLRGEIEARSSWHVNSARVAVAAPWLCVLLLSVRGDSAGAYRSAAGVTVLVITAAVSVVAYAVMLRVARLPQPTRLGSS